MGEIEEAMNELKAKLEDKVAPKPAGHQLDPADDEDQRKLFVGGLSQVNIFPLFIRNSSLFSSRMPRILTSRSTSVSNTCDVTFNIFSSCLNQRPVWRDRTHQPEARPYDWKIQRFCFHCFQGDTSRPLLTPFIKLC